MGSSSGRSELMRMMAMPSCTSSSIEVVDLDLGADVDAAGGLVEDEDAWLACRATWPSTTFCWLPPESDEAGVSTLGARMESRSRKSSAVARSSDLRMSRKRLR